MITEYNFLSLGAGVQSSALALMAAHGEIEPTPDAAIFADTQAEPASVYAWLDWLEQQLPFPIHRVSRGNLTAEAIRVRDRQDDPSRKWIKGIIPAFTLADDGSKGILMRACTNDYKVAELIKAQRRLAGIRRGQKDCTVTCLIGISYDELQRMKPSREPWVRHSYPLVDRRIRRQDCLDWMQEHGYPQPPRSACIYCPYHSNSEWLRLRSEEPGEFARAVQFEKDLQAAAARTDNRKGVMYLHPSRIPLDRVDFDGAKTIDMWNSMDNECEGLCGV